MSILDLISTADGTPSANYLHGGRTVLKISRVTFREATATVPRNSFRIDGEILKSTNPRHAQEVGMQGTVNLGFKYANQDLAKMRRALTVALSSAEGRMVKEAEITTAKSLELCGEDQPLVGAIVTVVAVDKPMKNSPDKLFTNFEIELSSESDLEGLFE